MSESLKPQYPGDDEIISGLNRIAETFHNGALATPEMRILSWAVLRIASSRPSPPGSAAPEPVDWNVVAELAKRLEVHGKDPWRARRPRHPHPHHHAQGEEMSERMTLPEAAARMKWSVRFLKSRLAAHSIPETAHA